ncbi:hypothetical protein A3C23_00125 [Candidatus Roizmanbacteria bacterium RIFCSPHIGHO2_02_FULL_37_13b]|uniref:Peptidase S11 D-alanyl-D-alanine carboxypeptidase A N-terminal domain-containing protein n=1 Tax=Candidatus Roizmanbacteria bacterium RIFCSPLOWO2_02_FULL_36_11 TaxID=1802071 RepID=A0A1F7JHN2_9BACT|nr:MAG: hypothetical protein A3C23_00125 [Candidatus Roizmanbacteria bacterium RIFCSPHIGHO2_02_FULL_37_13b]OGK55106.1 MAG: hypothetical protein A3H78_03935 [Candidatus Roizmanbacteria bacterium RIFCSPLOWO2_02_FULL_36_11]
MKFKTQFVILLFSLLFLFYPGDSYYIKLFFFNRDLFANTKKNINLPSGSFPYSINPNFIPQITAEGSYVIDSDSFTPIFQKQQSRQFLPASTTKIITALVAFDYYRLDSMLTVERVIDEGQSMGLVKNEKITFENLLYGLLVHSGNDAAYVIADNYPGGEKAFITAMNHKSKLIKMRNSVFKNPAGLDSPGQYTTPFDLALAARQILINKTLAKIVSTKSITVSDVDFKYFHSLNNVNKLLGEIQGIGGLKTGYTLDAGENLVTFYKKNGHDYLIVILKSLDRFEDTKRIVEWINTNVGYINI